MINLQTADSFDKVYAFYKQQMPANSEKMKMSAGGTSMAEFQVGDTDADRKSVAITQKGSDPTSILITMRRRRAKRVRRQPTPVPRRRPRPTPWERDSQSAIDGGPA